MELENYRSVGTALEDRCKHKCRQHAGRVREDGAIPESRFSPTSLSIRTAAEYRFNAALGISYRIEASTDFTNWTTIETNIIGAGGVMTRFYSIEGQPRRFFRSRRN